MCNIVLANEVRINPNEQRQAPPKATFLYENFLSNGPTNKPDKFIITSRPDITIAAPAVPTLRSLSISLNNSPNEGSIPLVDN